MLKIYTSVFVVYIHQAFNLVEEDLQKVMPTLSTPIKKEVMTAYDRIVAKGYEKGKIEGKIEGEIKGEIKAKLKVLVDLLVTLPNATDDLLVAITKFPKATIVTLKKAFNGRTKKTVLKIGRQLFASVPNMGEAQWKEVDQFLAELWKGYKKEMRKRNSKS